MPPEETLLDPPTTPAPLFAYRALKGWLIGSPDSSPEHDDEREDKENTSHIKLNLNLKSLDGHRSEDIRNEQIPRLNPKLSPQKRKRESDSNSNRVDLVSPTKSILRTPGGGLTPRARGLRDVNVTFKSVSPEVQRKVVTEAKEAVKMKKQGIEVGGREVPREGIQIVGIEMAQHASGPGKTTSEAQSVAVSDTDLDDHFRRTEKEMKRLIRYGQKWRDVARRQDEDNARLRVLLDEAHREKRRLEAALRRSGTGREVEVEASTAEKREVKMVVRESVALATGMRKRDSNNSGIKAATATEDIEDLLDLTPPGPSSTAPTRRSTSAPNPRANTKDVRSQTSQPRTTSTSSSQSQPPTKPSTHAHDPPRPAQPSLPQRPASASASASTSITTHSPLTALQHRIEGSIFPLTGTATRTNMPEDRIAAVRKRLMAKWEARRAGGFEAGIPAGGISVLDGVGGQRVQAETGKGTVKDEESGVEWVGI